MRINRNNYELFFMDYLDGNLSDRDIRMLEDFLLINPDLRTELEDTEKISLSPEHIVFNHKDLLIKPDLTLPVCKNNFEDFCIAGSEGDLNEPQLDALNQFISGKPEYEKEYKLYKQLHLFPDKNISFPGKVYLKKHTILFPRKILYPVLSVAAAVTFILIIYLRRENISENMKSVTADLPASQVSEPSAVNKADSDIKNVTKSNQPEIRIVAALTFSSPKENKQTQDLERSEFSENDNFGNIKSEPLPTQSFNSTFEIKLPPIVEIQGKIPSLQDGILTYVPGAKKNEAAEYLNLTEYARKQLATRILGTKDPGNTPLTVWQIADAGINGINKLTGSEMKLQKRTDENGSITAYSFNSKLLSFYTTAVK